ncbi:MAG: hypothetical protein ACOY16_04130 [Chloroflexota bacterium]
MKAKHIPPHFWLGVCLTLLFWVLNWSLRGARTHYLFFGLWLGYCLTIDGLTAWRTGTSPLLRSWRRYAALFLLSAPVWWLFEIVNQHLHNWQYIGTSHLSRLEFSLWATLNFMTVIPAVLGSAELVRSFSFVQKLPKGLPLPPTRAITSLFFIGGWLLFFLMWSFPRLFFPFVWISIYFILEPLNVWLGNHHLAQFTAKGDWRPVIALWIGVLICGFFWEMWNYYSDPKWIYTIPWGDKFRIFEMPLLGYGGYLPFALELHAMTSFIAAIFGDKKPFVYLHPSD